MNYRLLYRDFIASRRLLEDGLDVFDRHHIVPRCLGGTDDPYNIIRLSHGDHLFAHILLAKIHGGKLVIAAVRMSGMAKYRGRKARARYDAMRRRWGERLRGGHHSPETIAKITAARRRRPPASPETRERISRSKRGVPWTEEARLQMEGAHRGRSGRPVSPETRARISAALSGRIGHPCSELAKAVNRVRMIALHETNGTRRP